MDEEGITALKKCQWMMTGGGPIPTETSNRLVQASVFAINYIGATEGIQPLIDVQPEDFPCFHFDDEATGLDWRFVEKKGEIELYKQVITRLPDSRHQGWFYTFPDIQEYDTQDIFTKVPGKPGFWRYYARSDDVIALSNGEKLNPVDIEATVDGSPEVQGSLVVGQGRFQPGIIIEPRDYPDSEEALQDLINSIWPVIEEMNKHTVAHGRILRKMVRLTSPDKLLPRVCIYPKLIASRIYAK